MVLLGAVEAVVFLLSGWSVGGDICPPTGAACQLRHLAGRSAWLCPIGKRKQLKLSSLWEAGWCCLFAFVTNSVYLIFKNLSMLFLNILVMRS